MGAARFMFGQGCKYAVLRAYWSPMKPMAGEEARSFWVAAPRRGEIRAETLRGAEPGEEVVRTLYSGVSRGTETLVFTGAVPPSEQGGCARRFRPESFRRR